MRSLSSKKINMITGYAMIAPLAIGLFIFYIIPVFTTIYYSFTEWGKFGGSTFIGMDNYVKMFSDPEVYNAIFNTLKYTALLVPASMALAIIFATLLNSGIKGRGFFRTIYFLPAVTMGTATALLWKYMFNSEYGLINSVLALVGIDGPAWTSNPDTAMFVIVTLGIWTSLGTNIILYIAGLQGISSTYYEAAKIDGAGPIKCFFGITVPLLTPTIFFQVTTAMIAALQLYTSIFVIFSSPNNPAIKGVESLAYLFYQEGFMMNEKGYAAAIAVLLLFITLMITMLSFKLQKKWVNYD